MMRALAEVVTHPTGRPGRFITRCFGAKSIFRGPGDRARDSARESPVIDPTHIVTAVISLMAITASILVVGAFWSLGRSGYRKD